MGPGAVDRVFEGQVADRIEGRRAEGEMPRGIGQGIGAKGRGPRVEGQGLMDKGTRATGPSVKGNRVKGPRAKGQWGKGTRAKMRWGTEAEGQGVEGQWA